MMKVRQAAANVAVMLVSVVVGLALCEAGARLFLNPGDYLSVTTIQDNILGITVAPGSAGFDEWGFRNAALPSSADVVAIGDSHTFGNTATMEDAWPSVLGRMSGLGVYNMGMGGYGPNQYYHLLTTKALKLHPKWVLCGLYFGDDFENAFTITYGLDHWSNLRKGQWDDAVNANIWDVPERKGLLKGTRNWLSAHSLIYRLVVHGPVLGSLKEKMQFRQAARNADPVTTALIIPEKNVREAFRPGGMVTRLDQTSRPVIEGMRITFELLKTMDEVCRKNGCQFIVVVIPTKETVFADFLQGNQGVHLNAEIEKVLVNERLARANLFAFLDQAMIPYVDTLPSLKAATGQELYARTTQDMHPGKNGYRIIGAAAADFLSRRRARF